MSIASRRPAAGPLSANPASATKERSAGLASARTALASAAVASATSGNSAPASTLDGFTGDPNFMTSLARGLLVIQAFTPQTPQMTISQLAVKTGISRAAVRRCLYTLAKLGFAGAEEGSRYALRPHMLALSNCYSTSNSSPPRCTRAFRWPRWTATRLSTLRGRLCRA